MDRSSSDLGLNVVGCRISSYWEWHELAWAQGLRGEQGGFQRGKQTLRHVSSLVSFSWFGESNGVWLGWRLDIEIWECSVITGMQSGIRDKSYGSLNLTWAFVFNFASLDILWSALRHPSQMLWQFEFDSSFGVQFRVSRYSGPQSDIRFKSYDNLNLLGDSVINFEGLVILCAWIRPPSEK